MLLQNATDLPGPEAGYTECQHYQSFSSQVQSPDLTLLLAFCCSSPPCPSPPCPLPAPAQIQQGVAGLVNRRLHLDLEGLRAN